MKIQAFPKDSWLIIVALLLCTVFWYISYDLRDRWEGLAPAPTQAESLIFGFGDTQFSYRTIGMMLQNAGDTGGRITNLKDYNYARLRDWLELSYTLDPRANYIPSMAAFYFSATKKKSDTRYLIDYLARAGRDTFPNQAERWRWLAQAVYLARFELHDQDLALQLANELAAMPGSDMPIWTKQMPAFVMTRAGKKKAARDLLLTIAATDKTMQAADIVQTCWYTDHNLRDSEDGLATNPVYQALCEHKSN